MTNPKKKTDWRERLENMKFDFSLKFARLPVKGGQAIWKCRANPDKVWSWLEIYIQALFAQELKREWMKGFKEGIKRGKAIQLLNELEEKIIET